MNSKKEKLVSKLRQVEKMASSRQSNRRKQQSNHNERSDSGNKGISSSFIQLFAVIFFALSILAFATGPLILMFYALDYPWLRFVFFVYGFWMLYDIESPDRGGWHTKRFKQWLKRWPIWDWFRFYFPADLITTTKIDTTRNYIMAFHPHGVYCLSLFANVLFNPHFEQSTGLDIHVSTLPMNFYWPVWREFILAMGLVSCDKKAIKRALDTNTKGSCMAIAVGGGEEFKYMKKGTMDLVLSKRKGFAKLALQTGSSLLPVIGFGENELFERITHPVFEPVHKLLYTVLRMAAPLFVGRFFLPIPRRVPLIALVGKPIIVEQILHPSQADIDKLHAEYIKQLKQLYDEYKDVYHKDRIRDMRIVA